MLLISERPDIRLIVRVPRLHTSARVDENGAVHVSTRVWPLGETAQDLREPKDPPPDDDELGVGMRND